MKSAKWENIFKGWNSSESATVHTLKQVPIFKELTEKEFNELEKLIINVPKGAQINKLMIEKNIGISREFNTFELQLAIGKKDYKKGI